MRKIKVERIHRFDDAKKAEMNQAEFILYAERVEQILQQQFDNKKDADNEFEEIVEWL